jgi:hypothetical protein
LAGNVRFRISGMILKSSNFPKFSGQVFRGTLFGVLLLVLIGWLCFPGVMAWRAVSSLFG